jgi:hypothetical protein
MVTATVLALAIPAANPAAAARPCEAGKEQQRIALEMSAPETQAVISLVASVTYDPSLLQLAAGSAPSVRQRVTAGDRQAMLMSNNHGSVLRIVASKAGGLTPGPLADVEFDRCAGARAATGDDLRCTIESCAGAGGPIAGCTCTIMLR